MKAFAFLTVTGVLLLTGCSTFEGLKSDLSEGYNAVSNTFAKVIDPVKEEKKKLPVYDGTCPPVSARQDLTHLVEFYNPTKPSDSTKVSEATITGVKNTCRVENDSILMQIDLSLTGKTGPKARVKSTDKPSFAYPYFVAVTDEQGNVVSKEIFAVTLSYDSNQKELSLTESVFQNMPFPDSTSGQHFNVIVGFQLTNEQLAYNAAQIVKTKP